MFWYSSFFDKASLKTEEKKKKKKNAADEEANTLN